MFMPVEMDLVLSCTLAIRSQQPVVLLLLLNENAYIFTFPSTAVSSVD